MLSGIIGLERSSWNKPAGFRTHALVGISAVLIMLCGEYMSKEYDLDYWPVKFFLISILLNNIFSDNLMWARLILPFSLLVIIAVPYLASKLKKKYVIPFYAVFFTYYIYKTVSQLIGMSSPFALGNIVVPYETWLFK